MDRGILRRAYDRDAAGYDERFRALQWPKYEATARRVDLPPGAPALDLGAGTGLLAEFLGRPLVGLDLSLEMLRAARRRGERAVQGDLERLPFRDHSFAAVFCYTAFIDLGDATEALAEVRRVLRPGGGFVVTALKDRAPPAFERALWCADLVPGERVDCGQDWGWVCERI